MENLDKEIEKILESELKNAIVFVCTVCGGGGMNGDKECTKCSGTGLVDWRLDPLKQSLSSALAKREKEARAEGYAKGYADANAENRSKFAV